MPAWWADRFTGVKIVHVMPANASANLPAVQSSYLLSDGRTGEALALLDGGALTDRRTAASSVLAARFLARPDSRRLRLLRMPFRSQRGGHPAASGSAPPRCGSLRHKRR